MKPKLLEQYGQEMYGLDWQSPLARALKINPRTVRRYYAGEQPIPHTVSLAILALVGMHRRILKIVL